MEDQTPHELIYNKYPLAARSISSLSDLAKINPHLIEQILELAIVIGIHSCLQRIELDKSKELINFKFPREFGPSW
jgi:hypothetical protein